MCTVVILRRNDHPWPLCLAGIRDEMNTRPWDPPGRWWPDRPEVTAGRDRLADGSWFGVNDHGVTATVLNRVGTLGPAADKRSRGELVLEALDHADAADAADALAALSPRAYRPFNLLIADARDAFWLRNDGARIAVYAPPLGLSMLTAYDLNDQDSARVRRHLADLRAAPPPDPDQDEWSGWTAIMARPAAVTSEDGMTIRTPSGFGSVSAQLLALPDPTLRPATPPRLLFSPGPPDQAQFAPIALG